MVLSTRRRFYIGFRIGLVVHLNLRPTLSLRVVRGDPYLDYRGYMGLEHILRRKYFRLWSRAAVYPTLIATQTACSQFDCILTWYENTKSWVTRCGGDISRKLNTLWRRGRRVAILVVHFTLHWALNIYNLFFALSIVEIKPTSAIWIFSPHHRVIYHTSYLTITISFQEAFANAYCGAISLPLVNTYFFEVRRIFMSGVTCTYYNKQRSNA